MDKASKRADFVFGVFGEGGLILLAAAIGWVVHQPFVFASLGPTAYELVEQPRAKSSRVYNIVVGHLAGMGAGFLALYVVNAWSAPKVLQTGMVVPARLGAVVLAAAFTVAATILLDARQPAALATTLLVAMGAMQTARGAYSIMVGVLIITAAGELIRRYRLKNEQSSAHNPPKHV